jgi:hypothetical protein
LCRRRDAQREAAAVLNGQTEFVMNLRHTLIAGLAAATFGLTAVSAPASAAGFHHFGGGGHWGGHGWGGHGWGGHGWHRGGWGGGGWGWGLGAGLAAGALAAGALGAYDYGYGPYYGGDYYGYGCPAVYDQWGNYIGRRCY